MSQWTRARLEQWFNCAQDPTYFVDTQFKRQNIRDGIVNTAANVLQNDMFYGLSNKGRVAINTTRQQGVTTALAMAVLHTVIFRPNQTIVVLSHKAEAARSVYDIVELAYNELPIWFRPKITIRNKNTIEFDNGCRVHIGSNENACRGRAINLLVVDNTGYFRCFDEIYSAVLPTIVSNPFSKVILASTGHGLDTDYDKFYDVASERGYHKIGR